MASETICEALWSSISATRDAVLVVDEAGSMEKGTATVGVQGPRRRLGDELAEPLVGGLDLLLQGQDAHRHHLERCLGRLDGVVKLGRVGPQPGTGRDLLGGRPSAQRLTHDGRAVTTTPLS